MEIMQQYPSLNESEKRALLFQVLKQVAAGKDGVEGTADDIIDAKIVAQLKYMLENNIVQDVMSVVTDAAHGKFDIVKTGGFLQKCLPLLSCLMPKTKIA